MNSKDFVNPFSKRYVQEYEILKPEDIDLYDVVYFIDNNWEEITEIPNAGDHLPEEVLEILNDLDINVDDFSDAWEETQGEIDWEDDEYMDDHMEDQMEDEDE
jgi:hypothetical protein